MKFGNLISLSPAEERLKGLAVKLVDKLLEDEDGNAAMVADILLSFGYTGEELRQMGVCGEDILAALDEKREGQKRYAKCICDYIEDCNEYWTEGCLYEFRKQQDGNYKIKTNFNGWGYVGPDYMCDSFEEYFEIV